MPVHATTEDLLDFLTGDVEVDEPLRLLARASVKVDELTSRDVFAVDDNDRPTDTKVLAAFRDATCAQVEQWLEVGEHNDIDGLAGTPRATSGGLRAPEYAPRAVSILRTAGLASAVVQNVSAVYL